MLLGIMSDSHDRVERVVAALDLFRRRGVDRVLHCGDIASPQSVALWTGWTVDFVLGNCDWDPAGLTLAIEAIGGKLHRPFGDLEIEGTRIAWLHSDDADLFRSLERADHYDWLFYGHTHVAERHATGTTQVVNPGALHRVRTPSVALLELPAGVLTIEPLEE